MNKLFRSFHIMTLEKQQRVQTISKNVVIVKKRRRPIKFEDSRTSNIGVEPIKTNLWILPGGLLE